MKALFDKIRINMITFETEANFVVVDCTVEQNGMRFTNSLTMSHSDLNKLISRLNKLAIDADYSEKFEVVNMPEGGSLYMLNLQNEEDCLMELEDVCIEELYLQKIA